MTAFAGRLATIALAGFFAICPQPAGAYRPFDGTDAAVVEPDKVEVELGPTEYIRQGAERLLVAPDLRLNYGVAEGWEAVIEGRTAHGLSTTVRRTSQVENGLFLQSLSVIPSQAMHAELVKASWQNVYCGMQGMLPSVFFTPHERRSPSVPAQAAQSSLRVGGGFFGPSELHPVQ